jgi:outer membrane protein OmpA-like peptidoglycan-associated protein
MKKLLLLLLAITGITIQLKAQTEDKKWNIGLFGGISQYKGDLGNDMYKTDMAIYGLGGASFTRLMGKHIDLNINATKGVVGYNRPSGKFNLNVSTASVNIRLHVMGPNSIIRPYLFLGGGFMLFDKNIAISTKAIDYMAPSFGAGINFKLSPSVMLNFQEMAIYTNADNRDGKIGDVNDAFLFHTIGLSFNFGNKKDADNDGVSDGYDKCPYTPANTAVDRKGCPLDKDADGVADYIDKCPDVAGTKEFYGCPDTDADGVADADDECPDVKGTKALKGCPDTDGDGVADKNDRCISEAGTIALKGCPDKDGDGVADMDDKCADTKKGFKVDATGCTMDNDKDGIVNEEDACPDKSGPMALKGCPDTDGDGVADNEDRCPMIKGTLANKGCPEMAKADVKRITQIAGKIFFEVDKDKLLVASLNELDELATILQRYPEANLTIGGHTDSDGDDAYNMTLSQKRTDAVRNFLISKGITEMRLTATGYGESMPIADNTTAMGKAKNRRVELKTSY